MRDIRPEELKIVEGTVDFLEDKWPEYFEIRGYEHPVFGARKSLKIIPQNIEIDLNNIESIHVSFDKDFIEVRTVGPSNSYKVTNIIKNKTVM